MKKKSYKKRVTYKKSAKVAKVAAPKRTYRKRVAYRRKTTAPSRNFARQVESVVAKRMYPPWRRLHDTAQQLQATGHAPTTCTSFIAAPMLGLSADYWLTVESSEDQRVTMVDCHQTIAIQNQSLTNAELTLYWYHPRRDVPVFPTPVTPDALLLQGLVDNGMSSASQTACDLSVTPFMSPDFCTFFKITKSRKLILAGGKLHTEKLSIKGPRVINGAYLAQNTTLCTYALRGLSRGLLIFLRGQPTNDSSTTTNVGYTDPKLDIVTRTEFVYATIPNLSPMIYTSVDTGFGTVTTAELITSNGQAKTADVSA